MMNIVYYRTKAMKIPGLPTLSSLRDDPLVDYYICILCGSRSIKDKIVNINTHSCYF